MTELDFPRPVRVVAGLGQVRVIGTVREAFDYLPHEATPPGDEALEAVLDACRGVIRRECSTDEAHDVFVAYARRRNILVDEELETLPGTADGARFPA